MKILTVANEKGGVGKTLLSVQFAFYCAFKFGLKVAVLDLDQQANTTIAISANENCSVAELTSSSFMLETEEQFPQKLRSQMNSLESSSLVCFPADDVKSFIEDATGEISRADISSLKKKLTAPDSETNTSDNVESATLNPAFEITSNDPEEGSTSLDKDSHPELNQINELMICDEFSHIPLFEKCVSGHVSDKTSFKDVIIAYWSLIKEQFKDLRYLVADSALCTSDNAKELALQHLYSVTRIPDSYGQATECFKLLAQEPDKLVPVDSNEPDGVKAMWCGECTIGEQKFKRLLVQNELLHNRKEATITKKANKELEKVQKALTKLETKPCRKPHLRSV